MSWVPRLVRDQQKQLKQAYTKLEASLGRPATEEEIAEEMGIEPQKLDKLLSSMGRANLLSLDDLRMGSEQQRLVDLCRPMDQVPLTASPSRASAGTGRRHRPPA